MENFSESLDLDALRVVEARIAAVLEKTPKSDQESLLRSSLNPRRRSKTVHGSPSFVSDAEIIEDSPNNCERMPCLSRIREKIQKNASVRPQVHRTSLKRNKSDSTIRRSRTKYQGAAKEIIDQQQLFLDSESIDLSRLRSILDSAKTAISPQPSPVLTNVDNQLMVHNRLALIKAADGRSSNLPSPIPGPVLKRQRSEDVPLDRFNSDTPHSSQLASMLNLPMMCSQDMGIIDSHPLESTNVNDKLPLSQPPNINDDDDGLHDRLEEKTDHENITFTKQNTMEMFHLAADLRGTLKDAEEMHEHFNRSNLPASQSIVSMRGSICRPVVHPYQETNRVENRSALDASVDLRLIASWNLPNQIEREYRKKGIVKMFDWQVKCLNNPRVLMENRHLVYSAPTSAGKTLVSEILMIKSVLERKKKALLILPFVSVVREKMFYLQDLLSSSGIRVDGFFGGYSPPGGFEATQLAICTIEKANSIVNKLLEQNKLDTLGIIVVDEVHLIGDPNRGYILELLLAKILYMTKKYPAIQIQLVAMSATLPQLELLCQWLQADMFTTDFRPVALNEMMKVNRHIYNNKMEIIRSLDEENDYGNDQDNIAQLCLETIADKCSVIVFCPTKERCEKLAVFVAETIQGFLKKDSEFAERIKGAVQMDRLAEVKSQLKLNCPTGLDHVLSKSVSYGCAFHHASLTTEERDIIETSFKNGALKLIAATSTLSSGVNLPARRVIIRTPMFGGKVMSSLVYKQMIGRAGRTGKDTVGESILVCTEQNRASGEELVMAQILNPITSCLVTKTPDDGVEYNMNNMKRVLLEIIAAGVATTNDDLKLFVHSTLFYVEHKDLFENLDFEAVAKQAGMTKGIGKYPGQDGEDSEENALLACIKFLIEYEFVRIQVNVETDTRVHLFATRLGLACLSSSLPPADGFLLFSELQRSRQCFVLESELQAIYLVTPYSVCNQMYDIDWLLFLELWEKLPASLQRVGELLGIKDSFIVKAMRGIKKVDYKLIQIHKRFFIALALQELVNEMSISEVSTKFKVSRGILQSLQQMSGTFAGIVTAFCNSLNWSMLSLIVSQFKERLFFGIHPDLMDLMRIPSLNSQRARALHKNGIETLVELAQASAFMVEKILYDQVEFQSEKQRDGEQAYEKDERNKIRNFFVTGRMGLTVKEGAALLIKEARDFLEMELGMRNMQWNSQAFAAAPTTEVEGTAVVGDVDKTKDLQRHSTQQLNNIVVELDQKAGLERQSTEEQRKVIIVNVDKKQDLQRQSTEEQFKGVAVEMDKKTELKRQSTEEQFKGVAVEMDKKTELKRQSTEEQLNGIVVVADKNIDLKRQSTEEQLNNMVVEVEKKTELKRQSTEEQLNNMVVEVDKKIGVKRQSTEEQRNNMVVETKKSKNGDVAQGTKISTELFDFVSQENAEPKEDLANADTDSDSTTAEVGDVLINRSHLIGGEKVELVDPVNFEQVIIIPICRNIKLFQKLHKFVQDTKISQEVGISVGLVKKKENCVKKIQEVLIGGHVIRAKEDVKTNTDLDIGNGRVLSGISICFSKKLGAIFYLDLDSSTAVPWNMKVAFLHSLMQQEKLKFCAYDLKEQLRILYRKIPGLVPSGGVMFADPKIVHWLMMGISSDHSLNQFSEMVKMYTPENTEIVDYLCYDDKKDLYGTGLNVESPISAKIRSAVEALLVQRILKYQAASLETELSERIFKTLTEVEMPMQVVLAVMECTGIHVNLLKWEDLIDRMREAARQVEHKIYATYGRKFNLRSTNEIKQIIGVTKGLKISLKEALEEKNNDVSRLIILYRKIGGILNKMLYPMAKNITDDRIYPNNVYFTTTGRINMADPSIQTLAKDFQINVDPEPITISIRSLFEPTSMPSRCFVSADFCQLELRILTHFTEDPALLEIFNSNTDVFRAIAAKWNNVSESGVTDEMRNDTKQICYGIIYGMGVRTLAAILRVKDECARNRIEEFHKTYPGIRKFIEKTLSMASKTGYVETLNGRRRYFPYLLKMPDDEAVDEPQSGVIKAQYERQAVNTMIQGSAADILKMAILNVEQSIRKRIVKNLRINTEVALSQLECEPMRADMVLHLHDELMYEVPVAKMRSFAKVLRYSMESAVSLLVPLRVKVKTGPNWGEMKELL